MNRWQNMVANPAVGMVFMKMLVIYFNTSSLVIMANHMQGSVSLWQGKCHKQKQNQRFISQNLHHSKITKQKLTAKVDIPISKDLILRWLIKEKQPQKPIIEQLTHKPKLNKSKATLLAFGFVLVVSTSAICQTEAPKIIAGISLGSALPTGKFAETNILDEKSGFAKQGYSFGIDGVYFLAKNFGVCAAVRLGSHPMDVQKIANGYAEVLGGRFTVSAGRWHRMDVYAGACITIPVKKLHIDLKMMPGISNMAYPELRAESDQYSFYQFTSPTKSVGFCASGAIRYTLSESFSLGAFAETNRTKSTFNVQLEVNGSDELFKVDQPVSINTFGLSCYYNIY